MQNKPNLLNAQMNVNTVTTKDYENKWLCTRGQNKPKTKPKQTQSNPTCRGVASGEAGSNPIFKIPDNLEILVTMEAESVDLTPEPATLLQRGLGAVRLRSRQAVMLRKRYQL